MKRRLSPLAGMLAVLLPAAHGEVRLSGRVIDENSAAVAGAQIILTCAGTESSPVRTASDPSGGFTLAAPTPGECFVSVEKQGFFRLDRRPVLLAEEAVDLVLVVNEAREIFERVQVSYSPPAIDPDTSVPEEKLTATQLLAIPYPTTNNLRNVMRAMPGVVQDNAGGIHLNGGSEEQILYTLDGFEINDPLTGRFESRLSVEAVRTMEVSAVNLPAEFGRGSAGTLAIKTATGDDRFRYSGTNFLPGVENRKGLTVGNWTPRANVSGPLLRGRAWFSNSIDAQYDKRIVEELPEGEDRTASWRVSDMLRNQVNLSAANILYTGFLASVWTAPRTGLGALDPLETTVDRRSRQWFFHVKDQAYFRRGGLVEIGYAANRTYGREIPQGRSPLLFLPEGRRGNAFLDAVRKAQRDQWLANAFAPSFTLLGGHQVKFGIDVAASAYWQSATRTGYGYFRADGGLSRWVEFAGSGLLRRSNTAGAGYVQDSWRLRPGLLVEIGLREDWDRILGRASLSPRAGFAWAPPGLDSSKISGGYGRVYEQANLRLFTRPQDQYSLATYFCDDGAVCRGPAASVYLIDGRPLRAPVYDTWNLAFEHRLPASIYARLGYLRKRGRDGLTYVNEASPAVASPDLTARFAAQSLDALYRLRNVRRDVYDAFEVTARQTFLQQYEWSASYTRSRALSNAVMDVNVDDPLLISGNVGRMPWDAPNRLIHWAYLPLLRPNWAVAYLLEWRHGFPFSVHDEKGWLAGRLNDYRFPQFFEWNLHIERRFFFRKNRWAFRVGFNNITGRRNPNAVNNYAGSPDFLSFYGGQSRALNFRIRWLGKN